MDRYVLCRPECGLNDMLNQIEHCCRYAESFGRKVIVDTDFRNIGHFRSPFSDYFVSRQPILILSNPFSDAELDSFDVVPRTLNGIVSSYQTMWDAERRLVCHVGSGHPVSFDFRKDYPEKMLIQSQYGGGVDSVFALLRMRLHDRLADKLIDRLRTLPRGYAAMHIRNTDLTTDYRPVLAEIQRNGIGHLFLATDNAEVIRVAREMLPATTIHSFADLPDNGGMPLHLAPDRAVATLRNTDSILDLLTLALSRRLFILRIPSQRRTGFSGFSLLAKTLNNNRSVLRSILDRADLWRYVDGA